MKKTPGIFILASLSLLLALPAPASAAATQVAASKKDRGGSGLKGHRALYDIRLVRTQSGSQVLNISGQMLYEWQVSCEAWISNHRFNVVYEYADSAPMRIDSDFSTYESFDGQSLNFTSQRKRDGELFEELRGQASLPAPGARGKAVYTLPAGTAFDLPPGSLFPVRHSMNVLESIREGKKFYRAVIFDGSDGEGPVEVNAFIGKPVELPATISQTGGKPAAAIDKELLASPAHKVRLAFFPMASEEETSDYEMSMVFHENGIISDMVIEYDDFSISQKLVALEPLPVSCNEKPRLND